jgi:hypothetical protein
MDSRGRWDKGSRKALAVILVLALLAPGLTAKEKRGHDVLVTMKDGKSVSGELLAVKGTDLIIMDGSTAAGITASLADVRSVKVIKNSKFLKGVGWGFIIGAPLGALIGAASGKSNPGWFEVTPAQGAVLGAISLGTISALVGGVFGAAAGADQNIPVSQAGAGGLASIAGQLRPFARDRG